MKLGIVADEIHKDFGAAVAIGKPLGLLRYEVRNLKSGRFPMCDAQEIAQVEEIVAREGVEITAISPGLFKHTGDEQAFRAEMDDLYPRAAEWAHHWRLPGIIVFGFAKGSPVDAVVGWFGRASERARADGLILMIEPEPICAVDTACGAAGVIRGTGAESLRINYDPGNVGWLTGEDPIEEFDSAAPFISNVHVKDLTPGPVWLPAGEGIIDYRAHFAALRRIGYDGPVSLEPHMDGSAETIDRCKAALEERWKASASR